MSYKKLTGSKFIFEKESYENIFNSLNETINILIKKQFEEFFQKQK